MKVVVFSDSHGDVMNMVEIVRKECPDRILHLGDMTRDADKLLSFFPDTAMECVSGNCDGWHYTGYGQELLLELLGHRLLLLHGHTVHVKNGIDEAVARAGTLGAEVLLFGHTHIPCCDLQPPLWILNPGSVRDGAYGVLTLSPEKIYCACQVIA
ncbi:MAG: metallophosphoesterase family protein [Oscillospiraceae bacterium]